MDAETLAALACSNCGGRPLKVIADVLRCDGCGRDYPTAGGVPCLVPDPALFALGWRRRLEEYVAAVEGRLREIGRHRERADLSRRTRERLLRVMGALQSQRRDVETLMAPIVAHAGEFPHPADPGVLGGEGSAAALSVLHHYENIFRDWAWGEKENERQRTLVQNMVSEPIDRLAVYGAGAGRLAADLHERLTPVRTFALDVNPLPLMVGDLLARGTTLDLVEFPIAPRDENQVAVRHQLRAQNVVREGLTFMLADALHPPFAPSSLDVVVTSWFIDVVGADLDTTATAINRVLRPGGLWLNLGPLLFKGSITGQHGIGEATDIVRDSGFEITAEGSEEVPYFRSPFSGSSRIETVFWSSARKTSDAKPAEKRDEAPPWLSNPALPVPQMPQFAQLHRSSVFTIGVLSMIDGRRSIDEMATTLARSWNTEVAAVQNQLRGFFSGLFHGS